MEPLYSAIGEAPGGLRFRHTQQTQIALNSLTNHCCACCGFTSSDHTVTSGCACCGFISSDHTVTSGCACCGFISSDHTVTSGFACGFISSDHTVTPGCTGFDQTCARINNLVQHGRNEDMSSATAWSRLLICKSATGEDPGVMTRAGNFGGGESDSSSLWPEEWLMPG
ncbi:hypothetical protein RRG08_012823 [Elysia crispata]|uniref:Uncharacterized protein n=1 Tax=Elysia crispata TaxID=231223 RepID=A0AAE0XY87_9GAST|nr:hypothetical protein RRG08_012823 [Elysia crispata]